MTRWQTKLFYMHFSQIFSMTNQMDEKIVMMLNVDVKGQETIVVFMTCMFISGWRDCYNTTEIHNRIYDTTAVQDIYNDVKAYRTMDDNSSSSSNSAPHSPQISAKSKRRGLKKLFTSTPPSAKFSKSVKRQYNRFFHSLQPRSHSNSLLQHPASAQRFNLCQHSSICHNCLLCE